MLHCIVCSGGGSGCYKVHYWVNGQNWNSSGILKLLKLHMKMSLLGGVGENMRRKEERREGANEKVNEANY